MILTKKHPITNKIELTKKTSFSFPQWIDAVSGGAHHIRQLTWIKQHLLFRHMVEVFVI